MSDAATPMPRYQSHKKVWALKIETITFRAGGAEIVPAEEGYGTFFVPADYMLKHDPKVGGYYVVYDDGYKSFSPADAFEGGYTRLVA